MNSIKYETAWNAPPVSLRLPYTELHIWRAPLDVPNNELADFTGILSPDELERSGRFYFEKTKRHFIVCRYLLRKILELYLNRKSHEIKFSYTPRGKPELDQDDTRNRINFSLSHSHGLVMYAFMRKQQVGIDVEHIRPMDDIDELARRFFSEQEYNLVRSSSEIRKREIFFTIWTLKEAYLKATGEGLAGLEDIEVSFSADNSKAELRSLNNATLTVQLDNWIMDSFSPAEGYLAAVASGSQSVMEKRFFNIGELLEPIVSSNRK